MLLTKEPGIEPFIAGDFKLLLKATQWHKIGEIIL